MLMLTVTTLITITFFSPKCTKCRWAAWLCPDPLGSLSASRPPPNYGWYREGGRIKEGRGNGGEKGKWRKEGELCTEVFKSLCLFHTATLDALNFRSLAFFNSSSQPTVLRMQEIRWKPQFFPKLHYLQSPTPLLDWGTCFRLETCVIHTS